MKTHHSPKIKLANTIRVCIVMALALFASAQRLSAYAKISFNQTAITVSQTAGAVNIPVTITPEQTVYGMDYGGFCNVYTTNGTALSGTHFTEIDYGVDNGNEFDLTSPNTDPFTGSISVPITYTGSTVDRTFAVILEESIYNGYAEIGAISNCTITILAEPVRPPIYFSLGAATYTVSQNAGVIQIPVSYTGDSYESLVSVKFRTIAGTANGTSDYTGTSEATINYATGSTQAFIVIPINLTNATQDKTFSVQIYDPSEGQVTSLNTAAVTITGIPAIPPIEFTFGAGSYSVNQTSGYIRIPVSYTGTPKNSEVWVEYYTEGITGVSGTHYQGTSSKVVTFPVGKNTTYISVPIYYSGSTTNRTFMVHMNSISEGVEVSPSSALVNIKLQKGPPTVVFETKQTTVGKRVIKGRVINVPLEDVARISLVKLDTGYKVRGKTRWESGAITFGRSGNYPFTATVQLRNGEKYSKDQMISVR